MLVAGAARGRPGTTVRPGTAAQGALGRGAPGRGAPGREELSTAGDMTITTTVLPRALMRASVTGRPRRIIAAAAIRASATTGGSRWTTPA